MNIICEALEGEGYGPSQVSADEVVRHLWWQRENLRKSGGVAKDVSSTDPDSGDLSKQFEVRVCVHTCVHVYGVCVCACVWCVCVCVCVCVCGVV